MRPLLLLLLVTCRFAAFGQNLSFRSLTTYPIDLSDVWGWTDGTNEYALVGTMNAFTVVDVTDPDHPERLNDLSVPGPTTYWRDIKTWGHYAYGVHDNVFSGFSQGLVIMDLAQLPQAMPTTFWSGTGSSPLREAHNLFIDEKGRAFIVGHNLGGGVLILDLTQDPRNPVVLGSYNANYVHDCFVRNDTLWTSDGGQKFSVIDVSDPSSPTLLARGDRPGGYSHNIWASDDGRTVFTTDESGGGKVLSHDVTDLQDITVLDEFRTSTSVIPHNVHVYDDFLVISYYRDGVVILDGKVPDDLVEVGSYDTSPNYSGNGFNGCWGVYPYLPSGNILAADIEEGLYVLTPDYIRAVHFRGTVRDAVTGETLSGASVRISGSGDAEHLTTDLVGAFHAGFSGSGAFTVETSLNGYHPSELHFNLSPGDVKTIGIELRPEDIFGGDTLYAEVTAGESVEVCDSLINGFQPTEAYICDGSSSSVFGSWSVTDNGCLEYMAGEAAGAYIDTICMVVTGNGDPYLDLVVFSILSSPTATIGNGFENGRWSLLNNPARHQLLLENHSALSLRSIEILAVNGQHLRSFPSGSTNRIALSLQGLPHGLLILRVESADGSVGYARFLHQ